VLCSDLPSVFVIALTTAIAHMAMELVHQVAVVVGTDAKVDKIVVVPVVDTANVLAEAREDPAFTHHLASYNLPGDTGLAEGHNAPLRLERAGGYCWGGRVRLSSSSADSRRKDSQKTG